MNGQADLTSRQEHQQMWTDVLSLLPVVNGEEASLQMIFTGDVHLGPAYNDERLFSDDIRELCRKSDYVVVNVEGPITDSLPSKTGRFVLHSSIRSANALRAFGKIIFSLANNHILDHGVTGLRDTIQYALQHGWLHIGAGDNLAQAKNGQIVRSGCLSVGLLAVSGVGVSFADSSSPGVFGDDPENLLKKRIHEFKKHVRWLVVIYHGGEEFTHIPMPARRSKLLRYLSYGADIVVAHHAHCVQRYERVGEKYVFYGLGNLVFDLDHHCHVEGTDESILLSLSFTENEVSFNPVFTKHERSQKKVFVIQKNANFSQTSNKSYAREWGNEAARHLDMYWNSGHNKLQRSNWKQNSLYCLKKLRRAVGLLVICVYDKGGLVRPYIIGGVAHHITSWLQKYVSRCKTFFHG